jgi:hypothetical protein
LKDLQRRGYFLIASVRARFGQACANQLE